MIPITRKVAALQDAVLMSVVTRVELGGGVYRDPANASVRRARLDAMLAAIPAIAFDDAAAAAYEAIVAHAGYSRRKLLDRVIADKSPICGYHFPFPGAGTIEKDGTGYRWVPAPWNPSI